MKKLLIMVTFLITNACAFSSNNIQLLYGNFDGNSYIYDVKNSGKYTMTYEHFNTFEYGDLFLFIDYTKTKESFKYQDKKSDLYSEVAPRLSIIKIADAKLQNDFVSDIYIATEYNQGENYTAYLYGMGFDLKIPFLDVSLVNIYKKNQNIGDNGYQVTSVYKKFIEKIELSGYFDLTKDDFTTQNQFLYDVSNFIGVKSRLKLGIEWLYYKNKDNDIKSNTVQAMIKYEW